MSIKELCFDRPKYCKTRRESRYFITLPDCAQQRGELSLLRSHCLNEWS